MKIYIGSDHAGVALKSKVLAKVQSMGCDVEDLGPYSEDRVDYPVYGRKSVRELPLIPNLAAL